MAKRNEEWWKWWSCWHQQRQANIQLHSVVNDHGGRSLRGTRRVCGPFYCFDKSFASFSHPRHFWNKKLNWNEFRLMSIRGITNPFALSRVPENEFKFAFWLVCSANPRANTRAAGGFGDLKWHAEEKWTEWQDPPGGRQVTSVGQPAGSCSLIQTFFSPFVSMFHSLVNGRGKPSAVSKWKM